MISDLLLFSLNKPGKKLFQEYLFLDCKQHQGRVLKEDIYDFLQAKLLGNKLFVIFVLSDSYYNSAACLNEMGAAWVLKANYSTLILPGFQIPDIKGAVNPRKMAVVLDDKKRVNGKLTQLKDRLIDFFDLPETEDDTIWENDRNKFINIANT